MTMQFPFVIRPLEVEDASAVKNVALLSWQYTYKDIFSAKEIQDFNDRHYSISSLESIAKHLPYPLYDFQVMLDWKTDQLLGFAQIGYKFGGLEINDPQLEKKKEITPIYLYRIYFHPDHIGRGLGRRLLSAIEEFVHNEERHSYGLMVHSKNAIGKGFYEKSGFIHTPSGDEEGELYYTKSLI